MANVKKTAPRRAANASTKPQAEISDQIETNAENVFAFSETARGQYDQIAKNFGVNAEELQGRAQEMMDAAREGFETAQTKFQTVSAEAMEAARVEMAEAVEFANELGRAKTMAEALEIQRAYWTRLFETRVERARAMTHMTVEAMRETVEPMTRTYSTAMTSPAFGQHPFASAFSQNPFASAFGQTSGAVGGSASNPFAAMMTSFFPASSK